MSVCRSVSENPYKCGLRMLQKLRTFAAHFGKMRYISEHKL